MAITLVGYADGNAGWAWPAGASVGDVAIVVSCGNGRLTGLTGWNPLPYHEGVLSGSNTEGAWKKLTSADLASAAPAPAIGQGFCLMGVFRGATTAKEASAGTATTLNSCPIPGFTKEDTSKGIMVFQGDRDPVVPSTVPYPAGFTGIVGSNGTYFTEKISYINSESYSSGSTIDAPLPDVQYNGIGIAFELFGETTSINANFVGPSSAFAAELNQQYKANADFVGPKGSFASLLVPEEEPPVEIIRHTPGSVYVVGNEMRFSDVSPTTFEAVSASFVGPRGRFAARLTLHPEIEADFVGPFGSLSAELFVGPILTVVADFIGPMGSFDASLEEYSIAADFVGPSSVFSAELEHFSVNADFVGPSGSFSAEILNQGGAAANFVGPSPKFDAELGMFADIEDASFVGPFGYFSAQLGADMRDMEVGFVGPSSVFATELYTTEAISADFLGPYGGLGIRLDVIEQISAGFVGPFGKMDALITRGPRLDAFFVGPRPNFSAELEKGMGYNNINLLLIQP